MNRSLAVLFLVFLLAGSMRSQESTSTPQVQNPVVNADYPQNRIGILVLQGQDWLSVGGVSPSKVRIKHGLAASFSYGAVRGVIEADYDGLHAATQVAPGKMVICICHLITLPGQPWIVRLHPQKGVRELDGGKLPIIGGKIASAANSDLIPADVSHPEDTVWIVRATQDIPEGEYALMLGTENTVIYPFTVASNAPAAPAK